MPNDQALLKRNPSMTQQGFSDHWFNKHAPLVVPYFLHCGVQYYAQTHAPLSVENADVKIEKIVEWDGAAEMMKSPEHNIGLKGPQWVTDYYQEVILVDERRFLVSEALQHILRVPGGGVTGEKRVVIEDGKIAEGVLVSDEIWKVWREYEKRGQGEVVSG